MKPTIKFDLFSLLEDFTKMTPEELGVDQAFIIAARDNPATKERTATVLMAGRDIIDASRVLLDAMKKDPDVATVVSIASHAFAILSEKNKRP